MLLFGTNHVENSETIYFRESQLKHKQKTKRKRMGPSEKNKRKEEEKKNADEGQKIKKKKEVDMVGMCSRMCGIEGERIGKKDFRNGKSSEPRSPPSPHQFLNSGPENIALLYITGFQSVVS